MTDIPPSSATLFAKLAQVTAQVRHIPKNGVNAHFNYKFATDADVSAALSKELSERNVQVFVGAEITDAIDYTKDNGKKTRITNVLATVTFACGDTGATFTTTMPGTGDDAVDKGTYKAITGAVKYALLKTFLVATGDDPEQVREQTAALDAAFSAQQKPATASKPVVAPDKGVQAVQAAFDASPVEPADDFTFSGGKHAGTHLRDVPSSYLDYLLTLKPQAGFEEKNAKQHAMFRRELHRRDQAAA